MPMIPSILVPQIEKAAVDNGFDLDPQREGAWIRVGSSQTPLALWFTVEGDRYLVALSQAHVADELSAYAAPSSLPLPPGAAALLSVAGMGGLHQLVLRAFQLSKTLPNELLYDYLRKTSALPKTTEAERVVVVRVGQALFRAGLLSYWENVCAISGLDVGELLVASHIKPWADCESDNERLDVFNGLLLASHLDALFDKGFLTLDEAGNCVISPLLSPEARQILGVQQPLRIRHLTPNHQRYLAWHRTHVFRKGSSAVTSLPE